MNTKAIIFDLDGTLLNTIEDIAKIINIALLENGFPEHENSDYAIMVGFGLKNLVLKALPQGCTETDIEKVFQRVIFEYLNNPVDKTTVYPEIPELLNELTKRKIPMAILSNKSHEITCKIVSIALRPWQFKAVIGARINIPRKPDPYSAMEISGIFAIKPSNIFFIGDSGSDVKTALSCGMNPIGVSWGYRSVEDIKKSGATVIIDNPMEILNFII